LNPGDRITRDVQGGDLLLVLEVDGGGRAEFLAGLAFAAVR